MDLVVVTMIRPFVVAGMSRLLADLTKQNPSVFCRGLPKFFSVFSFWLVVQDVSFDPVSASPVDVLFLTDIF
jgi:hypothetical protein